MQSVKYCKIIQLNIINSLEYRFNFILKLVSGIVPLLVQVFIWTSVFNFNNITDMFGYDKLKLLVYVAIATGTAKLLSIDNHERIAREIKMGELNFYIIKPLNHMLYWLSSELGSKVFYGLFLTIVFSVISITILKITLLQILLGCIMVLFSIILNFLIFYLISLLSFWFIEISSIFTAVNMIIIFVGGGVIPLDLILGRYVVWSISPFSLMFYVPIKMFVQPMTLYYIGIESLFAVAWIVILLLICNIILNRGLKKYVAVGG